MRFHTKGRHIIDLIFPIALFFVFAASALAVVILAADVYSSTTKKIQTNDENRTVLSYISAKVRQSDSDGGISITEVDGTTCLTIRTVFDDIPYITYIYEQNSMLTELFLKEDSSISLKSGKEIMPLTTLSMKEMDHSLFYFESVDKDGTKDSLTLSERSAQ